MMVTAELPRPVLLLGMAGWSPQALCLILAIPPGSGRWVGPAAGCFYAAMILSFLGGMWWMAALLAGETRARFYILAVLPSLAAWATLIPWLFGRSWPGPSLVALGVMLLASPLADRMIAGRIAFPSGWLRLRLTLAAGLGALTLALALPG